jgi:gamma-glutamyltranspeptidase / glutathione hydrolase
MGAEDAGEAANTTHATVADSAGNVISTPRSSMGYSPPALVPGTGMLTKNCMYNFDPHPDRALSIAPGKRVFTSMATTMVLQGGQDGDSEQLIPCKRI